MANPNSSAQRSFAAEPYDSVAAVLASKQLTGDLGNKIIYTKDGHCYHIPEDQSVTDWHVQTAGSGNITFNLVASTEWPSPRQSVEVGGAGWVRIVPPSGGRFVGYPVDKYLQSTGGIGSKIVIQQVGDLLWNVIEVSAGFRTVDEIALAVTSTTASNISSATYLINIAGKSAGRQIWDTINNRLMTATGSTTTSTWVNFDGSVVVTPCIRTYHG